MFLFQFTGKIVGLNSSRDGKVAFLKVMGDPQDGLDIDQNETPDLIDLHVPSSMVPQGCGLGTRVAVEGTGAITAREWIDPKLPGSRPKIINNTRMQARAIKLAK